MEVNYSKIINKDRLLGWRFAPMPDIVRRSPVLSDGAKILYNEIVSYIWQKSDVKAWPSQDALGINLGISRQCIGRRLGELESVGLIGVSRRGLGRSNELYIYEPDPVRLQVIDDGHGSFRPVLKSQSVQGVAELSTKKEASNPVVATDVTKPLHQDVTMSLHQDVTQTLHQDVTSMIKVEEHSQGVSLDMAQVSAIEVGGESESCINKKREEEAGPHTPQFSNLTTDRKETVVKTPNTKLSGNEKSQKEISTHPDNILWSRLPQNQKVDLSWDCKTWYTYIDGKRVIVIDDRVKPQQDTSPSPSSLDVQSENVDAPKEPMPSDVVALAPASLENQSDNSDEIDADVSAQIADGIEDYDLPDFACPTCEAPLLYEHGRVVCRDCKFNFGYRKFKERFIAQPLDDISISSPEAAQNRLNLNLLLSGIPSKKSEGEKLLDDLKDAMSETRVVTPLENRTLLNSEFSKVGFSNGVTPSEKLFGGDATLENPIDALMENKNENGNISRNGNGGKRSKEEILRRLKTMDIAAGIVYNEGGLNDEVG